MSKSKKVEDKIENELSSFNFRKNIFKGQKKEHNINMDKMQDDIDILKKITEKLDNKVDKLKDVQYKQSNVLSSIEVTMKRNTDSLIEHMRRTKASEDRLEHIEASEIRYRSFIKGASIVISLLLSAAVYFISNFK